MKIENINQLTDLEKISSMSIIPVWQIMSHPIIPALCSRNTGRKITLIWPFGDEQIVEYKNLIYKNKIENKGVEGVYKRGGIIINFARNSRKYFSKGDKGYETRRCKLMQSGLLN